MQVVSDLCLSKGAVRREEELFLQQNACG